MKIWEPKIGSGNQNQKLSKILKVSTFFLFFCIRKSISHIAFPEVFMVFLQQSGMNDIKDELLGDGSWFCGFDGF